MTKQSQKNIQIVKVQVGDVRKKRKARKKTVKRRVPPFGGTGQAPVLGKTEYFTPPMFPTSRAGTQFELPKQQVVEPLQIAEAILARLEMEQQNRQRQRESDEKYDSGQEPVMGRVSQKEYEEELKRLSQAASSPSSSVLESPPSPLLRPKSPLVSAESSSSSSASLEEITRPFLERQSAQELFKMTKEQLGAVPKVRGFPEEFYKRGAPTPREQLANLILGKEQLSLMRRAVSAPQPLEIPKEPLVSAAAASGFNDPTGKFGYRPAKPQQPIVSAEAASSSAASGFNDPTGKFGYKPAKK